MNCTYCNGEMLQRTKDHILAKSKGGTNQSHNIVLCCKWCNQTKSSFSRKVMKQIVVYIRNNHEGFPANKPKGKTLGRLLKGYFKKHGYPDPITYFFYEYGTVNPETGETIKEFREKIRSLPEFKNYVL